MLNFAVVFVDVVAHRNQEDLSQNLLVAAKKKLPEPESCLMTPKTPLDWMERFILSRMPFSLVICSSDCLRCSMNFFET